MSRAALRPAHSIALCFPGWFKTSSFFGRLKTNCRAYLSNGLNTGLANIDPFLWPIVFSIEQPFFVVADR